METTHFPEPESNAPFFYSAAAGSCTACGGGSSSVKRPSSASSLQEQPNPKKISLCPPNPDNKTPLELDGFTKLPLPITSPLTWASPDNPTPTLRRCVSDPVNSPRPTTNNTHQEQRDYSSTALVNNYPLSPKILLGAPSSAWTPSPAKPGSSASATLPAVLRRSFSDPSPKACQSALTPHNSVNLHDRKSKRVKRMRFGMGLMRQWLDEVMREGEDEEEEEEGDVGYGLDDKNEAPKDHESETGIEEGVSVETSGEMLIIHIKCPCGKGFQILLHQNNCYYKLL